MTHAEELYLKTKYEQDPSFAYSCSESDLQMLLVIFGEMEPIIDAINVRNGASVEQRAADIGCDPEDFFTDREANPHDDSMHGDPEGGWDAPSSGSVEVSELIQASRTPWEPGS